MPAQLVRLFGSDSLSVDAKHLGRDPGEEVARQLEGSDALELGELFVDALHDGGPWLRLEDLQGGDGGIEGRRVAAGRRQ